MKHVGFFFARRSPYGSGAQFLENCCGAGFMSVVIKPLTPVLQIHVGAPTALRFSDDAPRAWWYEKFGVRPMAPMKFTSAFVGSKV
jgi:hypothetical protein